jgi:hypothetical protein
MPAFHDMLTDIEGLSTEIRRQRFHTNMDIEVDLWASPEDKRPVILVMSTGSGVVSLFENLMMLETGCIICVICGRQADLRRELEGIQVPLHHRACFVGFTCTMHELMGVADIIVTKPGGLITSEALACGLMMVIVDPYPGQEERNATMLLEAGAAIQAHRYNILAYRLGAILSDRETLDRYRQNSRKLGRPDAAQQIVRCIMSEGILTLPGSTDEKEGAIQRKTSNQQIKNGFEWQSAVQERTDSTISSSPLQWFESPEVKPGTPLSKSETPISKLEVRRLARPLQAQLKSIPRMPDLESGNHL